MGRKKVAIHAERGERLKILIDREKKLRNGDFNQTKFAKSIHMSQQNVSRIVQKHQNLYEETAQEIVKQYPEYRIEWLMGYDDYMTMADYLLAVTAQCQAEKQVMNTAFFGLARLCGFSMELNRKYYDGNSLEGLFQTIKSAVTFSRDGMSVTLSLEDINEIENELCDIVEARLKRMLKKQC